MQLVMQVSIKVATVQRASRVKIVLPDNTRAIQAKAVAVNVPVDNTQPPDSHRVLHVVLGSMPRVQLQPVVKTVMQANIRPMIRQPHIPAPPALLGRTL